MNLTELKAIDWPRAANFYGKSPDGQWDNEATLACKMMPLLLTLLQKCNAVSTTDASGTIYIESDYADDMCLALDAANAAVGEL